jgi:hypothetical protein
MPWDNVHPHHKTPISPPVNPARLHKPWNEARIGRLYNSSAATAWVFTDMFTALLLKPNTTRQITNCITFWAKPEGN